MRTQPTPTRRADHGLPLATLALALALPCAAMAAPPPLAANGIPVDPSRSVSGSFTAPGTQTWQVYLQRGRYYAVWGVPTGNAPPIVSVQAAGGRQLAWFQMGLESGGHGGSFRAPYTGLYTVAVVCDAGCFDPRNGYTLSAGRDCPDDLSTRCGIAPGQTLHGLQSRFVEDDDWFRTRLAAGHHYRLNITVDFVSQGTPMMVAVRDARGRVLARGFEQGTPARFLDFVAPTSGAYYVEAAPWGGDAVITYSLSLTR